MSQQINLYDPSLLRKREFLTAGNLAAMALVLLVAMGGWGASVRAEIAALEGESISAASMAKALAEQVTAVTAQLADIKPDRQLAAALGSAQALLGLRGEVVAVLKKGIGSESVSFAEYLRGLARQTPSGLWLTGFAVGNGGATMEIRGRMSDPALLPLYIQRLNGEKAFKGRGFAALKVAAGTAETPAAADGAAQGAKPAAAAAPAAFHEFVLIPSGAASLAATPPEAAPKGPEKLADLLPPDAARVLDGKR